MKIGFLGFGEVASILSKTIIQGGGEAYTCVEKRSSRTQENAEKVGVNICPDDHELARISDILISAVVPSQAVTVAQAVGKHCKGVYVDINNVSAYTVKKALGYIENRKTVDAAIMGGIKRRGAAVTIISSGNSAPYFARLNDYGLRIKVISTEIGQASTLKMLRSSYTKGVSALLFESLYTAYTLGLEEELLNCLEETECPGFRESALSRITSSIIHGDRKSQEMDEVLKVIKHPRMTRAASDLFKQIANKGLEPGKRLGSPQEIIRMLDSLYPK